MAPRRLSPISMGESRGHVTVTISSGEKSLTNLSKQPKVHATARLPLSKALSPKNVLELQPYLNGVLERLIEKFKVYAETGQVGSARAVVVVDASTSTLLGTSTVVQKVYLPKLFRSFQFENQNKHQLESTSMCGRKQCQQNGGEMGSPSIQPADSKIAFERLCRENQRTTE